MRLSFAQSKQYLIDILNGMALGLFASLIIGLILKQIGVYTHLIALIQFGQIAQYMMGPTIGVGVAYSLKASPLGIIACLIVGALGAGSVSISGAQPTLHIGEPVGALLAAWGGALCSKFIQDKTQLNILLVPAGTIIVGGLIGSFVAPFVAELMSTLGAFINLLTTLYPFPMSILIAMTMGIILTLPISSAAIAISLGLSGLAAGASVIGCCCQMVGFAVISFRENGWGGLISQGLGTSMLQVPNIVKNPKIWLPAIIASAIVGPIGTLGFHMVSNRIGAGMGSSGFVGQFATLEVMGSQALLPILLTHFILPALIALLISEWMRHKGWIKPGDLKIEN
ncbi:PTS transporter subunit IIC [Celerinatantimonas yamalensis]|uniref:PTS sugar transporter subunit IIC n=1 Tax=Celerinatantimonas yamalensis TaxID=559956 RepID=A0ABW9G5T4_9GAMM